MQWEPEGTEQLLQEHLDDEQVRNWPRRSGSDDRQVLTAQVVTRVIGLSPGWRLGSLYTKDNFDFVRVISFRPGCQKRSPNAKSLKPS